MKKQIIIKLSFLFFIGELCCMKAGALSPLKDETASYFQPSLRPYTNIMNHTKLSPTKKSEDSDNRSQLHITSSSALVSDESEKTNIPKPIKIFNNCSLFCCFTDCSNASDSSTESVHSSTSPSSESTFSIFSSDFSSTTPYCSSLSSCSYIERCLSVPLRLKNESNTLESPCKEESEKDDKDDIDTYLRTSPLASPKKALSVPPQSGIDVFDPTLYETKEHTEDSSKKTSQIVLQTIDEEKSETPNQCKKTDFRPSRGKENVVNLDSQKCLELIEYDYENLEKKLIERYKEKDNIISVFVRSPFMPILPEILFNFSELQTLRVDYNPWFYLKNRRKFLPPFRPAGKNFENYSLRNLKKLNFLQLEHGGIEKLPTELEECQNLYALSLGGNCLDVFPSEICSLQKLMGLHFPDNYLSEIPLALENCREIDNVNFSYNLFYELPEVICRLPKINKIDFSFNFLSDLPNYLENVAGTLEWLTLEGNCFTHMPAVVSKLINLESLSFSHNHLSAESLMKLPEILMPLQKLKFLWLVGAVEDEKAFKPIAEIIKKTHRNMEILYYFDDTKLDTSNLNGLSYI